MPEPNETQNEQHKVAIAIELGTDVLVGILQRRARAKGMDFAQLLAEAAQHSQNADRILDAMEAKDRPAEPVTDD